MKKRSRKEWRKIINRFEDSGKSQSQWARENGFDNKQISYWVREFRKEEQPNKEMNNKITKKFVSANIITYNEPQTEKISVKIGSSKIEVEKGFDKELLIEIIKVLKAI